MVDRNRNAKWRKIWALRVPQRVRVFMWLAAHQSHLTNVERVKRHLADIDGGPEDIDHILDVDHVERKSILERGDRLIADCGMAFGTPQQRILNASSNAHLWEGPCWGWVKRNVDAAC
ncbi:hypothetical protein V6N13_101663 [Hibiscus sabdariffa]|uniref:Reverse transcriptase zinc-binding domain-containing protein n=1 Tax=Hibiscus sabdariffa TaxID=183260 RepID=A0ABR2QM62_9ROSI